VGLKGGRDCLGDKRYRAVGGREGAEPDKNGSVKDSLTALALPLSLFFEGGDGCVGREKVCPDSSTNSLARRDGRPVGQSLGRSSIAFERVARGAGRGSLAGIMDLLKMDGR